MSDIYSNGKADFLKIEKLLKQFLEETVLEITDGHVRISEQYSYDYVTSESITGWAVRIADEINSAKLKTLLLQSRIDAVNQFVEQLHNNHNDMPIGTPSQYVSEQQLIFLAALKASQEKE